jgi:hypothetical protein
MKIYYEQGRWIQSSYDSMTWGKEKKHLPFSPVPTSRFIEINQFTPSIQPLVGILTGDSNNKDFAGNERLFQRIQLALQKTGGLSYVFTSNGFSGHMVKGFAYDFKHKVWLEALFPTPDIVYNRIPFRRLEQDDSFQQLKAELHSSKIPFFNDCFFSKWEIYELLSQSKQLHSFLPNTKKLTDLQSCELMLGSYPKVYIKPSNGKKGKGIIVIEKINPNSWQVQTIDKQVKDLTYQQLVEDWINPYLTQDYIIQQAIEPLKWNGARFDYRVFVHRKNKHEFVLSGIGVRQSHLQEVTTHIPAGGKMVPFSKLPFSEDKEVITMVANQTGQVLLQHFQNIGEFSLDIGKCVNGDLFIFEVNSKPMVFDEDEIRRKGLEHLIQLFTFFSLKGRS